MKANELMIDDWVLLNEIQCQVEEISRKGWVHLTFDGCRMSMSSDYVLDLLKPIPLTPEILEKNGCTRYGKVYANLQQWILKVGDKRKSFVQDIRTGGWNITDYWIKYVHEFQHALKLCKIEKEIEL